MPRVKKGARLKVYTPRTRTGCLTCRIRRVKCDEVKPNCEKCTSTGRSCDSYEIPSEEVRTPPSHVIHPALFDNWGSDRERRSLHFFRVQTLPQLSSCIGSEFWDRLILQSIHHVPAFKHAVIAVGFLHEMFETGGVRAQIAERKDSIDYFGVQQYNLAIKYLLKPFSSGDRQAVDICLASCVLFACFESLRGHHEAAIAHTSSGMKMLSELRFNKTVGQYEHPVLHTTSACFYIPMEMLMILFGALDAQACQLTGTYQAAQYSSYAISGSDITTPPSFGTLGAAHSYLDHRWYKYMYRHMRGSPDPDDPPLEANNFTRDRDSFLRWSAAFDAYSNAIEPHKSCTEQRGITMLKMWQRFGHLSLQLGMMLSDQHVWDTFLTTYEDILALASELIAIPSAATKIPKSFTMDVGLTGPLYFVAVQCRHPVLRRRAILLLKSLSRQEGVWDPELVAMVAERIVAIEEASSIHVRSSADVPGRARISCVEPTFDAEGRRVVLKYKRVESLRGTMRKTMQEILEW